MFYNFVRMNLLTLELLPLTEAVIVHKLNWLFRSPKLKVHR